MIEVPCTLICDVCGAKKNATATLNHHITEMPPSPVYKYSYAREKDEAPWRVLTPSSKVICSDTCFAKYRKQEGITHYQEFEPGEDEDGVDEESDPATADTVDADEATRATTATSTSESKN